MNIVPETKGRCILLGNVIAENREEGQGGVEGVESGHIAKKSQ